MAMKTLSTDYTRPALIREIMRLFKVGRSKAAALADARLAD